MSDDDLVLPLTAGTRAPSEARQFVETRLAHVDPAVVFDITLAVSELVTNVVRHGTPPARLELAFAPSAIRVSVHDAGDPFIRAEDGLPASTSTSGRGLYIVAALARDWGIAGQEGGGKTVWFEIATAGDANGVPR